MTKTQQHDISLKILLIGNSGVGKSCILLRFAENKFTNNFYNTIGVDFKVKYQDVKGQKVKLVLWDTAGQQRFRTITNSYYRGAQGIVIVYDITDRQSFDNVVGWYQQMMKNVNQKVACMLVGNKVDLERKRVVKYEQGRTLENTISHFMRLQQDKQLTSLSYLKIQQITCLKMQIQKDRIETDYSNLPCRYLISMRNNIARAVNDIGGNYLLSFFNKNHKLLQILKFRIIVPIYFFKISTKNGALIKVIQYLHYFYYDAAAYLSSVKKFKNDSYKLIMQKKPKPNNISLAVTSAALQDHLLRQANFGFVNFKQKTYSKPKTQTKLPSIQKIDNNIKKLEAQNKNSILPYEHDSLKKLREAVEQSQKMHKYSKNLTLAQKLGLVEAPPPPLTNKQWQQIEEKSKNRNDSQNVCSICLENFKIQPQVILSCSHVFHSKCLNSYQKHNKVRCCPICRKRDYQKKIIDEAIRVFTMKCIIRIQRVYRGSRDRIRIYSSLIENKYAAKSKLFNRRLIGFKMWRLSQKIQNKIKNDEIVYNKILKNLEDKHKKDTEQIMEQMVQMQRKKIQDQQQIEKYLKILGVKQEPKPIDSLNWEDIKQKGVSRTQNQCPICLQALWNKPVYLLSCTHLFHVNCIQGFERYALPGNKCKCPCCRSSYQKKIIQNKKNK